MKVRKLTTGDRALWRAWACGNFVFFIVVFVVLDAALEIVDTVWGCVGAVSTILAVSVAGAYRAVVSREPELPEVTYHYPGEFPVIASPPGSRDPGDDDPPALQRSPRDSSGSAYASWGSYAEDPCLECAWPGDALTKGDGNCNGCDGTGIGDFVDAVASGPAVDDGYNCRRCGGTGVCPRCRGRGVL